jgi:hypothetical protein
VRLDDPQLIVVVQLDDRRRERLSAQRADRHLEEGANSASKAGEVQVHHMFRGFVWWRRG